MKFLTETYTPLIKSLQDLNQEIRLKLSSMRFYTEPEMQKLDLSLEEAHETAQNLNNDFYEIHLLLKVYENALVEHLGEAISQDLTDEDLELDLNMLH